MALGALRAGLSLGSEPVARLGWTQTLDRAGWDSES